MLLGKCRGNIFVIISSKFTDQGKRTLSSWNTWSLFLEVYYRLLNQANKLKGEELGNSRPLGLECAMLDVFSLL